MLANFDTFRFTILFSQRKIRRAVLDEEVDAVLREVCLETEKRYENYIGISN